MSVAWIIVPPGARIEPAFDPSSTFSIKCLDEFSNLRVADAHESALARRGRAQNPARVAAASAAADRSTLRLGHADDTPSALFAPVADGSPAARCAVRCYALERVARPFDHTARRSALRSGCGRSTAMKSFAG